MVKVLTQKQKWQKEETAMTKWTEQMREKLQKVAQETAKESVGRSVPVVLHEPKVPACLKTKTKAED